MACIEMTGKRKKHNGKEGRGQQFPTIKLSSVLAVCTDEVRPSRNSPHAWHIKAFGWCKNKHCGVYVAIKLTRHDMYAEYVLLFMVCSMEWRTWLFSTSTALVPDFVFVGRLSASLTMGAGDNAGFYGTLRGNDA